MKELRQPTPAKQFSRRDFLKTTGVVLGGAALAAAGLSLVENAPEEAAPPMAISFPDHTYGEKLMSEKVLVTYASQGGSTSGIADAIGKSLAEGGAQVDVRPVQSVTDLSPYQAVILGSAIHSGKWMPEVLDFIERNQSALQRIPTAVYQVCMMLATQNEQYRKMVPDWLQPVQTQIRPVAQASFAGALWPERYPKLTDKLGLRIFLAFIKLQSGDYRDWNAIRAWAESLRPLLLK